MKKILVILGIIIVILLFIGGAYFGVRYFTSKPETIYVYPAGTVGGSCSYMSYSANGQPTGECIDDLSMYQVKNKLRQQYPGIEIDNITNRLAKIEARVYRRTESRKSSAPRAPVQNKTVVVMVAIRSVSLED